MIFDQWLPSARNLPFHPRSQDGDSKLLLTQSESMGTTCQVGPQSSKFVPGQVLPSRVELVLMSVSKSVLFPGHPASSSRKTRSRFVVEYRDYGSLSAGRKEKTVQTNCSRKKHTWFKQMGKLVHCKGSVDSLQVPPTHSLCKHTSDVAGTDTCHLQRAGSKT